MKKSTFLRMVAWLTLVNFPTVAFAQGGMQLPTTNMNDDSRAANPLSLSAASVNSRMAELSLEINVSGAVKIPGTHRLPYLSRVSDALALAQGLLPEGSNRNIELFTRGQRRLVDLLKFQLNGDLAANPYLQNGDMVRVAFKQKAIRILGPIRNQGDYDLKEEQTIEQVTTLLGGFTTGYNAKGQYVVSRIADGEKKLISVDADKIGKFFLMNGDIIMVPHVSTSHVQYLLRSKDLPGETLQATDLELNVFVVGSVLKPGPVPYYYGYGVQEYIANAGGYMPMAVKNKVTIITPLGKRSRFKITKVPRNIINPGDIIEIDENIIPPQFWLTFMATLASIGLSATAIFTR